MFEILINNNSVDFFDGFNFKQRFNAITSELTINFDYEPNINTGDMIHLKFNKTYLLTGYIDNKEVEFSAQAIKAVINCRDNTADVIDNTINQISRDRNYSFVGLIKELTGLEVINQSGDPLVLVEPVESALGMNLADFLNSIAKQLGVFLQPDGKGNIVIIKVKSSLATPKEILNPISYRLQNDISERYYRYTCYAKKDSEISPDVLVAQVFDNEIRETRLCVFQADRTIAETRELLQLTKTKLNLHRAKGKSVYIKIPLENSLYKIGDYALFQNKVYFIDEINYNITINNKTVDLRLVDKDTYVFS